MSKINSVLVPLDSQDEQTLALALAYAERIAKASGLSDIILLTHTRNQLDNTGLSRGLGSAASKALAKKIPVKLSWGGRLRAETMKTLGHAARGSVIVAYYADSTMLEFVDGLPGIGGTVAVPWVAGEADAWAERWNVIIHGEPERPPTPLIEDPVVVRALDMLTSMINLSTGLGHPRDKDAAAEILKILRAKGHVDPSSVIKSWAIRNGWRPSGAADLESLARKIWSLKTKPSLSGYHEPDARYARWVD